MGQAIQESVGGGVVGLPRRAENGGYGGEEDEAIERVAQRKMVQQPAAANFGGQYRVKTNGRLPPQQPIIQNPGGVENAP